MDVRGDPQQPDSPLSANGPDVDPHSYSDYSRYVERGGELVKKKNSHNNFPARLHRILSGENCDDVVVWLVGHPESRRTLFP